MFDEKRFQKVYSQGMGATGLVTFDENQFSAADIDLDGSITSKDALSVLQFSIGLMKSL